MIRVPAAAAGNISAVVDASFNQTAPACARSGRKKCSHGGHGGLERILGLLDWALVSLQSNLKLELVQGLGELTK
jgi:hypothetical protein